MSAFDDRFDRSAPVGQLDSASSRTPAPGRAPTTMRLPPRSSPHPASPPQAVVQRKPAAAAPATVTDTNCEDYLRALHFAPPLQMKEDDRHMPAPPSVPASAPHTEPALGLPPKIDLGEVVVGERSQPSEQILWNT